MQDKPYANLIAFIPFCDYKKIIFFTPSNTRKYMNLSNNKNASIFIDNRSNSDADIAEASAVNAAGKAVEIKNKQEKTEILSEFIKKHPAMEDFIKAPSTVMFQLNVETYYFVEHFQQVVEIHLTP
jgi:nitroimidazol reductase NimA-like FMN-containing flavoprotein (pyridoxamine 5'-phosphate oxidase superfamily)